MVYRFIDIVPRFVQRNPVPVQWLFGVTDNESDINCEPRHQLEYLYP